MAMTGDANYWSGEVSRFQAMNENRKFNAHEMYTRSIGNNPFIDYTRQYDQERRRREMEAKVRSMSMMKMSADRVRREWEMANQFFRPADVVVPQERARTLKGGRVPTIREVWSD